MILQLPSTCTYIARRGVLPNGCSFMQAWICTLEFPNAPGIAFAIPNPNWDEEPPCLDKVWELLATMWIPQVGGVALAEKLTTSLTSHLTA